MIDNLRDYSPVLLFLVVAQATSLVRESKEVWIAVLGFALTSGLIEMTSHGDGYRRKTIGWRVNRRVGFDPVRCITWPCPGTGENGASGSHGCDFVGGTKAKRVNFGAESKDANLHFQQTLPSPIAKPALHRLWKYVAFLLGEFCSSFWPRLVWKSLLRLLLKDKKRCRSTG